jgi:hypothetical protein
MSPRKPKSSNGAVRVAAPLIPLAIALLHSALIPATTSVTTNTARTPSSGISEVLPAVCQESIEDYQSCHSEYPTGCSASGKYDAFLNVFKNQIEWPQTQVQRWFTSLSDITDLEGQLPNGLGKSNHGDFTSELKALGEGKIHGVVGYLYAVKAEGKESSNCQLDPGTDDENVDFHIFIGFDSHLAGRLRNGNVTAADKRNIDPSSMIVEMTPHYRGRFHPEWTLKAVKDQIGQQVRVEGQLMVDNEHYIASQDCGRSDHTSGCWRGTVWELHPVTDFEVCASGNCTATSAGWTPIGGTGNNP